VDLNVVGEAGGALAAIEGTRREALTVRKLQRDGFGGLE